MVLRFGSDLVRPLFEKLGACRRNDGREKKWDGQSRNVGSFPDLHTREGAQESRSGTSDASDHRVRHFADRLLDAVHYTQMSRALKVAEEYAVRLLQANYPAEKARGIARHLVEKYPEHEFVIDADEAASFGLRTVPLSDDEQQVVEALRMLATITVMNARRSITR